MKCLHIDAIIVDANINRVSDKSTDTGSDHQGNQRRNIISDFHHHNLGMREEKMSIQLRRLFFSLHLPASRLHQYKHMYLRIEQEESEYSLKWYKKEEGSV